MELADGLEEQKNRENFRWLSINSLISCILFYCQLEKRKLGDEPKHVLQREQHLKHIKNQNCLRKFNYNTESQVLLYLARLHCETQQWQDCRKTLLRAIHLAPSNYTLRFGVGVAIQKSSALTLHKTTRTVDELLNWSSEFMDRS
ncbi:protein CTR9 [Sesamum alatum]|uniref:Protein CTR9 n=1 Tax=Sesamum alatum TaxID=300844 RepID=A0AAE1XPT0_9LAMI|nr:protein CTR9 [Sesamum alatum]